jgi:hypothetical protein
LQSGTKKIEFISETFTGKGEIMEKKHFNILVCLAILFLTACAPSQQAIQAAMTQTQAAIPTPTNTPEPTPTKTTGKWETNSETSSVGIHLHADVIVTAHNALEDTEYCPVLSIRCSEKAFSIIINSGSYGGVLSEGEFAIQSLEGDKYTARFRFDKGEEFDMTLGRSTDGQEIFFKNPEDFLNRMIDADVLVFGFTPELSDPISTIFDLRGLSHAVKPIVEACK